VRRTLRLPLELLHNSGSSALVSHTLLTVLLLFLLPCTTHVQVWCRGQGTTATSPAS
jgi:hypothetical protein